MYIFGYIHLSNKMAEKGKKGKKRPVEEIFKDAFKPRKRGEREVEEKPISEKFKDIFKPEKVGEKMGISEGEEVEMAEETEKRSEEKVGIHEEKEEERAKVEVTEEKPPDKPTEMSVIDIMKDAHKKGLIDKDKYDRAIQKMVKRSIKDKGNLIGEIEFIERGGRPEIVLEEGEIEIPRDSRVEVVKRDGEISIIVKKGAKEGAIETKMEDLEKLTEGIKETRVEKVDKKLMELEKMDWMEGYEEEGDIMGEVKEEVELTDLRKEFREEKKEEEVVEEEVGEERGPSFIDRIMKRVKKTTEESKSEKLRRLALENLKKVREIEDERKAIIGVAYVLKEFLEVKFDIPHELTYLELIRELRSRGINPKLKGTLITFFKRTSIMIYANMPKMDTFSRVYSLAERTINELS
ncbi:MAG: hypothetical protein DRO62_03475 [Candidatus Altiarchaeales archaeon]|nr:MAG: hypothetical protein DRO62_03475 [Candidatus Altiarchaeales archaeon]